MEDEGPQGFHEWLREDNQFRERQDDRFSDASRDSEFPEDREPIVFEGATYPGSVRHYTFGDQRRHTPLAERTQTIQIARDTLGENIPRSQRIAILEERIGARTGPIETIDFAYRGILRSVDQLQAGLDRLDTGEHSAQDYRDLIGSTLHWIRTTTVPNLRRQFERVQQINDRDRAESDAIHLRHLAVHPTLPHPAFPDE